MNGNRDFRDLLLCLNEADARYLIVGAYAVIYHTEPRYTKDLDIWVEPTPENAQTVWKALVQFGAPLADLTIAHLCNPEIVFQMGVEPNRIDVLMEGDGLRFDEAWQERVTSTYEDQQVFILSYNHTLIAKKTAARKQDLLDAQRLESMKTKKKTRVNLMSEPINKPERPKPRVIMSRVVRREEHNDRSFDLEFWEKVGPAGRFAAAWQMIKELQLMRGQSGELPRMQKNVTRVLRRSQMKQDEPNED